MADDLRAWFPLYVADMLNSRKVRKMNAEQFGIFMFLLIEQWVGGPLPEDKSDLCDMAKCDSWPKVQTILQAQFVLSTKGWVNERLVEIWMEQKGKRHAASRAGKIGAEARWGKKRKLIAPPKDPIDTEEDSDRNATALPPDSDRNATPMALEESRGEESREEKSKARKMFRDDTIYIKEGLAYPDQNGKTPTIERGYNEVPVQDFIDMAVSMDQEPVLPDPLVIETQEALDAWMSV